MIRLDLDQLKTVDHSLYLIASKASRLTSGIVDVDINQLKIEPAYRQRLERWAVVVPVTEKPPTPAKPATVKPVEKEPQIDFEAEFRADVQRAVDAQAATARLEQYAVEQGLARTPENVAKIQLWLDSNVRGYWSTAGVGAAIQNLGARGTNVLTWEQKVVARAPEPESTEPVEVLSLLPDGRMQIPLETTPAVLRKASKDQAKDWLKRSASRQQQSHSVGRFGSRF